MIIAFKEMEAPNPMELTAHPLADLFPMMEGEAFDELVEDIREHGLRESIVLLDKQILDGRNRLKACREAGTEPRFSKYDGDDPAAYVISLNLKRRHLTESQRSYVAGKLAQLPSHRPGKGANLHPFAKDAGKLLNVSERSVKSAKQVQKRGTPELNKAVEDGAVWYGRAA